MANYRWAIEVHIVPTIGGMRLDKVTPDTSMTSSPRWFVKAGSGQGHHRQGAAHAVHGLRRRPASASGELEPGAPTKVGKATTVAAPPGP